MSVDGSLPALKIEIKAEVTSFRYALYSHGFQPTYDMPPPSTIYGHICSALGRFMTEDELRQVQFGYHFTHGGKFIDSMEHLHFEDPVQPLPMSRQMLFQPRLTLYLVGLEEMLYETFLNPHYMVVLGRSQDLASYHEIKQIELQPATSAYFANTLLPLWMAPRLLRRVTTLTMARYIDTRRRPAWESYAMLQGEADWPQPGGRVFPGDTERIPLWVDPDVRHPRNTQLNRAVWFHRFVEVSNGG